MGKRKLDTRPWDGYAIFIVHHIFISNTWAAPDLYLIGGTRSVRAFIIIGTARRRIAVVNYHSPFTTTWRF
ncbi:hypothetical protein BGX30_003835 [Mortierella sp. GBA39]|nr:hypothetical protein BGX30_003835 [Mortierella sp. GBA39]